MFQEKRPNRYSSEVERLSRKYETQLVQHPTSACPDGASPARSCLRDHRWYLRHLVSATVAVEVITNRLGRPMRRPDQPPKLTSTREAAEQTATFKPNYWRVANRLEQRPPENPVRCILAPSKPLPRACPWPRHDLVAQQSLRVWELKVCRKCMKSFALLEKLRG